MDRLQEGAGNEEADLDLSQPEFDNGDAEQDRLLQLEAVAGADPVVDADGREADDIEDSLQAADDDDAGDEAIHFTMPRVDDADPAGTDDKPAAELAYAASERSLAASYESRILQFPNSGAARETNTEFEAEVKSTLQAMRDQLQYMTERLFRQERETVQLREALNRLRDGEDSKSRKGSKKSS